MPSARCALVLLAVVAGCGSRSGLIDIDQGSGGGDDASFSVDSSELDTGGGFGFEPSDTAGSPADGSGPSPDAAPATTCPPVLPKAGARCVPPLACAYVGCDLAEKDRAACVDGKWSISAAPCVSGPDRCPLAIPADGAACALPDRTGCMWSADCVGSVLGWCVGGKWTMKPFSCASVRECPEAMPVDGTACSKKAPGSCVYLNDCGVPQHSGCTDGFWRGKPIGCELDPECPAVEPAHGSACTPGSRPMCVWKNSCGGVDYGKCGWFLGEGQWTIFRPPCPAPKCPEAPPASGSCATEGESCTYPAGRGCTLKCSCVTGSWRCEQDCGS